MTLRLRLLLVLLGIVACGLLAADAVTYNQLDNFLYSRTDQQLAGAFPGVVNAVSHCAEVESQFPGVSCGQVVRLPQDTAASIPLGTIGELLDASGNVVGQPVSFLGVLGSGKSLPHLPAGLPGSSDNPGGASLYFSASGGGVHYRVLAQPLTPGGGTAVVAFPTTDISQTLGHLLRIEGLVTLGVLVALGALAWWMVRRELRPLDAMATTAGAIAAGDLTQRVEDDDSRTEVGRLGTALNTMLGNIERAFDARAASEERLRRFLADASHELRTPLTSIRGYAEMFDRGARDRPEDLAVSMRHIRDEADRMNELVNDLLLLARLDRERPLEHQAVDLRALADEAVAAARVSAPGRQITLSAPDALVVQGDGGRLRQVLDNLLTNADRYTPPGTPVE
ncbi:MAG TPA: HAMP domain-containing sensor histidine kinase, partial [Acidimicrobiales bacterium]|nr:HAMP domain-containing sensor histidine kinase [Acidimicrobiales bacterium]